MAVPTNWIDELPLSDDAWVNMLIDNELSAAQRERFVRHVQSSNDWQRIAIGFMDEQVMASAVSVGITEPPTPAAEQKHPRRAPWFTLATLTMGLLLGATIGYLARSQSGSSGATDSMETIAGTQDKSKVSAEAPAETSTGLSGSPETLPRLFLVSNTPQEAVYYADHSIPRFMLDALVIAGHRISFDQEFLGYTESLDDPRAVPINVIRIQKYENLVASTDAY